MIKDHISHSQIQTGRCMLKYKKLVIDEEYHTGNERQTLGNCVHKIVYTYGKHLLKEKMDADYDAMVKIIDHYFDEFNLSENLYRDVRKALILFGERGMSFEKVLDLEKLWKIEFSKGKFIYAVIDRINTYQVGSKTIIEIIDYKNHLNILSKTDVDNHEQLALYRYLACRFIHKGFDKVRVGIHHLMHNWITWGEMRSIDDLGREFEAMEGYLLRQYARLLEKGNFEPTMGNQCYEYGGCPILLDGKCPLFKKKKVEEIYRSNDVKSMVTIIRTMDMHRQQMIDRVKDLVKDKTFFEVEGKLAGYVPGDSYSYDAAKVIDFCKRYNVSCDLKDFNVKSVERLFKDYFKPDYKGIEPEIVKLRIIKKSTRFSYK